MMAGVWYPVGSQMSIAPVVHENPDTLDCFGARFGVVQAVNEIGIMHGKSPEPGFGYVGPAQE